MKRYMAIFFLILAFVFSGCTDKIQASKDTGKKDGTEKQTKPLPDNPPKPGTKSIKLSTMLAKYSDEDKAILSFKMYEKIDNFAGYQELNNMKVLVEREGQDNKEAVLEWNDKKLAYIATISIPMDRKTRNSADLKIKAIKFIAQDNPLEMKIKIDGDISIRDKEGKPLVDAIEIDKGNLSEPLQFFNLKDIKSENALFRMYELDDNGNIPDGGMNKQSALVIKEGVAKIDLKQFEDSISNVQGKKGVLRLEAVIGESVKWQLAEDIEIDSALTISDQIALTFK